MAKHDCVWLLTVGHSECKECHYSAIEGVAACVHCDESLGPTEIEHRLNAYPQLKAENEALREAIADLYKQRMGKISTIKLETGLLAHKIYDALLTGGNDGK